LYTTQVEKCRKSETQRKGENCRTRKKENEKIKKENWKNGSIGRKGEKEPRLARMVSVSVT
jgi:hypothetical protein